MKQHLIALDLDGTLLKDNKTISARSVNVINSLRQAGHEVVIATGRPYRSSKEFYHQLNLNSPIVNFNGAFVHHPHDSKGFPSLHSPLEWKLVESIIELCESHQVHNMIIESVSDYYLHHSTDAFAEAFTSHQSPKHIGDFKKAWIDNPTSLLIHPQEQYTSVLIDQLDYAHAEVIEQRSWGAPWNIIEIVKAGINKAKGLTAIADYYQIRSEHIIAFGDEDNDLEMLEYAGIGVAMGNGIEDVKAVANEETSTNEEDGVAIFLENYFSV